MRHAGTRCLPCKLSRKKCDENRPSCGRCLRLGKHCYGYGTAFSIIHNENSYASGHQRRPRGPRSQQSAIPAISANVPRDLKSEAIAYYIQYHLGPAIDDQMTRVNLRSVLLSIWGTKPELDLAVMSTAIAAFCKTRPYPPGSTVAAECYLQSLHLLRNALEDINKDTWDTCLLTTYYLGRYEDVVCGPSDNCLSLAKTLQSHSHLQGIAAILKHWKNVNDPFREPTDAICHSRRLLRKAALLGQMDFPEWLEDGYSYGEQAHEQRLDSVIVQIINLRKRLGLPSSQLESRAAAHTLQAITDKADALDRALQKWIASCCPVQVASRTEHVVADSYVLPGSGFYRSRVYTYQSHVAAEIWAQYYAYRILLKDTQIRALRLKETTWGGDLSNTDKQAENYSSQMTDFADHLASITPYCLGRFRLPNDFGPPDKMSMIPNSTEAGWQEVYNSDRMVLSLVVASTTPYLDDDHRAWFKSQLACIGRWSGYGIIEAIASDALL